MPTIYIDVLFLVNFFINTIIIYCTGKTLRLKLSLIRIIIGACSGALYSVFMFFPDFNLFYTASSKIFFSLFIIAVSYNIKGIKLFLKATLLFYLVTVFFGGCVFLLFCFTDIGAKTGAVIKNGIIYFDIQWHILFISVLSSFLFATVALKILSRKNAKEYIPLQIVYLGKSVFLTALVDTGNTLSDPITNESVIVAEFESIKEILPPDFNKDTFANENTNLLSRMRIIPFSSVGKENGILIGFKPDKIISKTSENEFEICDAIIGISNTSLSKDKSFQALLPPGIIM